MRIARAAGLLHIGFGAAQAKDWPHLKQIPTDDPLFSHGKIRAGGRTIHDMYLFQAKSPPESKAPYDYYNLVATIPGDRAFQLMDAGGCPLVAH